MVVAAAAPPRHGEPQGESAPTSSAGRTQAERKAGAATPAAQNKAEESGQEFQAPDGSFACRIPAGWKVRALNIGGAAVQVLEPESGGEERILLSAAPATAGSLQELAQQAIALVTQQLLPGFQVAAMPKFLSEGETQFAEITYVGMTASGQASWWHGLILKDKMALGVLGGARVDRAQAVTQQSRAVLRSMRPGKVPQNLALAAAILGKWAFYDRSGQTRGSVSKQIVFFQNGRYEYQAVTYIPDMPSDIDPTTRVSGTYQINGNILLARADNGQQATFTLELVPGGGLKIGGELFIRER
jgi:hypothetical protein